MGAKQLMCCSSTSRMWISRDSSRFSRRGVTWALREGGRGGGGKERRRGNRGRERRMDKGRGEVREGYKVTSATMSLLFKELLDV